MQSGKGTNKDDSGLDFWENVISRNTHYLFVCCKFEKCVFGIGKIKNPFQPIFLFESKSVPNRRLASFPEIFFRRQLL